MNSIWSKTYWYLGYLNRFFCSLFQELENEAKINKMKCGWNKKQCRWGADYLEQGGHSSSRGRCTSSQLEAPALPLLLQAWGQVSYKAACLLLQARGQVSYKAAYF